MNFIKQQSIGFYVNILALAAAVVALVYYVINCHTSYFLSAGMNPGVLACSVGVIVLELVILVGNQFAGAAAGSGSAGSAAGVSWLRVVLDVCVVAVSVMLMCAFAFFLSDRVNSIASIATFNQNAQNMADLMSAIYGMIAYVVAVVLSIVASYLKVNKRNA
ncbi:hypothetical protein DSM100688_2233 [Bifidobacterium ramosum]|uniref:Uncharacterized protein n=1 Tax=Bifidobacterium ramosum TaxID=1798158 RepID=A0A6L4WX21_9BIFI|nr:hypothetical protein [Bifidobacterium ramosum]KAB8286633.1 hypothetical protein DSM100688_2233 [Bifidobacterium ramosum]NEG72814.1 hypothetical protein [Bifidobacterium ramosum]